MSILSELKSHSSSEKSNNLARFFKTGKGDYGEGDVFLGVNVPESRVIAKKYSYLTLEEIEKHLESKFHEERLVALLILVHKYEKEPSLRKKIFDFYLTHTKNINNWDLVDLSAHKIVGRFLFDFGEVWPVYRMLLRKLAESSNLWERRISIVSTFYFIKERNIDWSIKIAKILMNDKHDLIHKACGWMLRELGKKDKMSLDKFLIENYKKMPRTMLRYAIEKHSEEEREKYLEGKF